MVTAGLVLTFSMALLATGCSKLKVDCEKVCERTFKECVADVLIATKKVDSKKMEMIKKVGKIEQVKAAGHKACVKDCKKKKGFGSDAGEINKCMKIKDCKEFAKCMKKHVK